MSVERVPAGNAELDAALGGGWPVGRVAELFGDDVDAMSDVCLLAVREAQAGGGVAAVIDVDGDFDPARAKRLGVELESLLVSQPDSPAEATLIARTLACSGVVSLVVVTSLAALAGDDDPEQARRFNRALRELCATCHRTGTAILLVSPLSRVRVAFGRSPGGSNAVKFYASVRVHVRRSEGRRVAKVVKNKTATPFRSADLGGAS